MSTSQIKHCFGKMLAQGDTCETYLGHDSHVGEVALVKLREPYAGIPAVERCFAVELRELSEHLLRPAVLPDGGARVPRILGSGRDGDNRPYLIVELHAGQSFDGMEIDGQKVCAPQGPPSLSAHQMISVLEQLARTLQAAVREGVVHGRLHFGNLRFDMRPGFEIEAVLLDLGMSRLRTAISRATNKPELLSDSDAVFLAPERRVPETISTDKSDIYSLGVIALGIRLGKIPTLPLHALPAVLGTAEFELYKRLLDPNPQQRPGYAELLALLHELKQSLGTFELYEELSRFGAFSEHRAYHVHKRAFGHLRRLSPAYPSGSGLGGRALDSARCLQRLGAGEDGAIFEVGELPGGQVFVFQALPIMPHSESLQQFVEQSPQWRDPGSTLTVMLELAYRVKALHDHRIVFSLLSPQTVTIAADGTSLRLRDVGSAVGDERTQVVPSDLPHGKWLGMLPPVVQSFLAPELRVGNTTAVPALDLYSLGAILYWLVSGHVPPNTPAPSQPISKLLLAMRPGTLPPLAELIEQLLDEQPSRRPSAGATAERLQWILKINQLERTYPVVADKYRIENRIGIGGCAATFRAIHLDTQGPVVLKLPRPGFSLARVRNEARAGARLQHPSLVKVFDMGCMLDGSPYIVLEHLKGLTLDQYIKERGGRLSQSEAVQLAATACEAIAAMHEQDFLHRDVSLDNLMVTPDSAVPSGQRLMVIDLGLVRMPNESQLNNYPLPGAFLGKPGYAAPEVHGGGKAIAQSDVYSMGVVLKKMLGLCDEASAGPSLQTSAPLGALLGMMLDPDPMKRPSMATVVAELKALHRVPPRNTSRNSHGWLVTGCATAALGILTGALLFKRLTLSSNQAPPPYRQAEFVPPRPPLSAVPPLISRALTQPEPPVPDRVTKSKNVANFKHQGGDAKKPPENPPPTPLQPRNERRLRPDPLELTMQQAEDELDRRPDAVELDLKAARTIPDVIIKGKRPLACSHVEAWTSFARFGCCNIHPEIARILVDHWAQLGEVCQARKFDDKTIGRYLECLRPDIKLECSKTASRPGGWRM